MLIWINGAFGAGKTQTAYELYRRLPGSFVYDPEEVGFFLREHLPPDVRTGDFQDYPMWRSMNVDILTYCLRHYDGHIIVPMTLTNRLYYDEIVGALAREFEVRHLILRASRETLLRRLASRLESPRSWAARQIDRCLSAFDTDITEISVDTDGKSLGQVVEDAAAAAGVGLAEDRRGRLRKTADRFVTKCRHIR